MLERGFSETKLLEELKLGNEKALVQLYKDNYTLVRNYVMMNNGKPDDVDDILQEAVIVVWQKVRQDDFKLTSKLSTFLMAICKNLWLKKLSKNKRLQYEDNFESNKSLKQVPDYSKSDFKLVHKMMDKIDEKCKDILVYFYFKELDNKEIAEKMNYSGADVVKSKKYQCLKKLQELVYADYKSSDFFG